MKGSRYYLLNTATIFIFERFLSDSDITHTHTDTMWSNTHPEMIRCTPAHSSHVVDAHKARSPCVSHLLVGIDVSSALVRHILDADGGLVEPTVGKLVQNFSNLFVPS